MTDEKRDISMYEDIINLEHHVSLTRPRMTMRDRAAQFAPFAALTGHGAAIRETARLTDERAQLDEPGEQLLSVRLLMIQEKIADYPQVTITYFCPDERKTGGKYVSVAGCVRRIDEYERRIVMQEGDVIPIDDIIDISGDMFDYEV